MATDEHRGVVLLFEGVKLLDVSGPAEVFAEAAAAGAEYRLTYVSPTGRPVTTSAGARLAVDAAAREIRSADTVLIAGGDRLPVEPLEPELTDAVRHLVEVGRRITSICTGAFLLAAVGALDHHRATTHWAHARLLARAYPTIEVVPDALFVQDGRFHTSAGVSSGIDLALALVETDHDADTARAVARRLVDHLRRQGGQSQFSVASETASPRTAPVRRALATIAADPAGPHTLTTLARTADVSVRHLSRLVAAELSTTPARLVEDHRVELAQRLLLEGATVTQVAARSGLGTTETLRRVFLARFGLPPSVYRQRFAAAGTAPSPMGKVDEASREQGAETAIGLRRAGVPTTS